MQEIELTSTQFILLGAAFGALFGLLLAMIPFFIGKKTKNPKQGNLALMIGPLAGALLGVPGAILSAVIFTIILIVIQRSKRNSPMHFEGDSNLDK